MSEWVAEEVGVLKRFVGRLELRVITIYGDVDTFQPMVVGIGQEPCYGGQRPTIQEAMRATIGIAQWELIREMRCLQRELNQEAYE